MTWCLSCSHMPANQTTNTALNNNGWGPRGSLCYYWSCRFLKNKNPPLHQYIPCHRPKAHVALLIAAAGLGSGVKERVSQGPFQSQPPTAQGTADWQAEIVRAHTEVSYSCSDFLAIFIWSICYGSLWVNREQVSGAVPVWGTHWSSSLPGLATLFSPQILQEGWGMLCKLQSETVHALPQCPWWDRASALMDSCYMPPPWTSHQQRKAILTIPCPSGQEERTRDTQLTLPR